MRGSQSVSSGISVMAMSDASSGSSHGMMAMVVRSTDIFEMRGLNREQGCMVIVRPDQYIAHVLPLHGFNALADFFAAFMLEGN